MPEKYSNIDDMAIFGFLANAFDTRKSADGDRGASFPLSDAEDFSRGVRFVPGEVTLARRAGAKVEFVSECTPVCWYWKMPDGTQIYHWDRNVFEQIAKANGNKWEEGKEFTGNAGACPSCGNPNTNGGIVRPK